MTKPTRFALGDIRHSPKMLDLIARNCALSVRLLENLRSDKYESGFNKVLQPLPKRGAAEIVHCVLKEVAMPALRITPKMKLTLERLYEINEQSDFVAYSTAFALEQRHLVSMPKNLLQRTSGGQFPEYIVTLTQSGRQWCERHFANIRCNIS